MLALLESHVGSDTPEVSIDPRPPTPLPSRTSPTEPVEKKRKRDKKSKKGMPEEGKIQPSKDQEPLRGSKAPKGQQRRSSADGTGFEIMLDCHSKVPAWNPSLELDGALLPAHSSIKDFQ